MTTPLRPAFRMTPALVRAGYRPSDALLKRENIDRERVDRIVARAVAATTLEKSLAKMFADKVRT